MSGKSINFGEKKSAKVISIKTKNRLRQMT